MSIKKSNEELISDIRRIIWGDGKYTPEELTAERKESWEKVCAYLRANFHDQLAATEDLLTSDERTLVETCRNGSRG